MTLIQALLISWGQCAFPIVLLTWVVVDQITSPRERARAWLCGLAIAIVSPALYLTLAVIAICEGISGLRRRA